MTGDRDRVKVTFEEQSPHCLRKERINRKSFRNLPPPKLPLLPSAAADPKRFPGKGLFPGSRGASAPTGPPLACGGGSSKPGTQKIPWSREGGPGCSPRSHSTHGAAAGFASLQELPAGILEQAEPPWHLGLLIFPAALAPFKSTAALPAPHPRNIPSDFSPFNGAAPNLREARAQPNPPFYSQIIIIIIVL